MKTLLKTLLIAFTLTSVYSAYSQEYQREIIDLWEKDNIPFNKEEITLEEELDEENKRFSQISNPTIFLYRKNGVKKPGPALLFCPGGGYSKVTINANRGESYAKLFFEMGFSTVAVLKYRLPDDRIVNEQEKVPLCDAQKAFSLLHKNARKWKIDKRKIGVMGSSAGGHLAASLANLTDDIVAPGVKKKHLRQAFSILMYPVISFNPPHRHKGSFKRLLVDKAKNQDLLDYYSLENRVSENTPATFLVHATDDASVSHQNSLIYIEQLKKHEISYHYIELTKGGHGFGLSRSRVDRAWVTELKEWAHKVLANQ